MPAAKLPKLHRSANSEASSRPAPPGKKSFASSRSACAVCFQAPPAPSHCSPPLKTASSPPPNGESVRPIGSSRPNNVGLFAADAPILIPADAPPHVALTCSAKVHRSAFLSSPMATRSEPCPSRMMIPCHPFLSQTLTPASLLAAASSLPPPPNTSRSRLPTLTCVSRSVRRPSATRSPASTAAATCRSSSSANSTPLAGNTVPSRS